MDSLRIFKAGLDRFAEWSGLRLNVQKSHLIISRSAQALREEMLALLGFQEGILPMRYLRLPLISSRLTIADCRPLLLKIDKRIAGWEGMTNSGYAKVAWKDICRPKEEGGLGFKDISTLSRALMTKKLCDVIRCDRTSIWVDWLHQGRLQHTSIWTITDQRGSWGWRKILRLRIFLRNMVDYRIGDGRSFLLSQDPWHHLGPLCESFPRGPRLLRIDESSRLNTAIYELFDPPGSKVDWSSLLSGSLKIPRHNFILWLAIQGKLATTDKPWLAHLGPCILCNEDLTETHAHLFFQCRFSRRCLMEIRRTIRFLWHNREWKDDITWASRRWRGKHIINMSYRALLASCVYHIWKERNLRRFNHTERTPTTIALLIIEDIRQRIHSITLSRLVSTPSSSSLSAGDGETAGEALVDSEGDGTVAGCRKKNNHGRRFGNQAVRVEDDWSGLPPPAETAVFPPAEDPNIGGDASLKNVNGGPSSSSFNLDEFLNLASRVIDHGDEASMDAVNELKIRWQKRLGDNTKPRQMTTMERDRERPVTGGLRKALRCLIPPDPAQTTVRNTANLGGRKVAGNESAAVRPPGAFFRRFREWTESSPATGDVCRKSDVDAKVDTPGADVAAEVGDKDGEVENERAADISPTRADVIHDARAEVIHDARADAIHPRADITNFMGGKNSNLGKKLTPVPLFIGNIPLHTSSNGIVNDKIADAFNNSSRKMLSFIAPTKQNGEVVVCPSLDTVRDEAKRWKSTAVGYFMGKRPYYHHLKEFAHLIWPALREVTATANGFFFFRFKTEIDMEEVIEGAVSGTTNCVAKVGIGPRDTPQSIKSNFTNGIRHINTPSNSSKA
ncbi:UNVERIFIED_CONTAM: hypothetical protein Sindi_2323200 [Sesamum indicum]